jgi:cyclopropane-fatty-acyl-phospholipid synthase
MPGSLHASEAVVRAERHAATTSIDRWLAAKLQAAIAGSGVGVELWDGTLFASQGARVGDLLFRDRRALLAVLLNPDLQYGEMYSAGRLDVRGDLPRVVEAISRLWIDVPISWRERLALWTERPNAIVRARRNIHHHYDLGNDFYKRWLDREMVYTCAYYPEPDATLEHAQVAKLDLVCRKLRLTPGETVVEAGCGWGGLALHMARAYGVRVRAFNISTEQIAFARDRARREGLAGLVEFIQDDYRNVSGRFDVFVSVGMLEHVGRRNFASLAAVLRRVIDRPNGRGLLHFIGRDSIRPLNSWTRRRIFPGAYAPSLGEVIANILEPAHLSVLDVENLRLHYARTLGHWRERYTGVEGEVRASFGDAFCRAWRLYLTASEAAFRIGFLQLFQVVFAPSSGSTVRWTRADLYAGAADAPR